MPGPRGEECSLCIHWGTTDPNAVKASCTFGPETRQIVEARAQQLVDDMQEPNLDSACKSPMCHYDKKYYFFEWCTGRFEQRPPP